MAPKNAQTTTVIEASCSQPMESICQPRMQGSLNKHVQPKVLPHGMLG